MASIQSLGVGSGLLTSELVDEIIAAEREATDLRLDAEKAEFTAKISAYGAIRSAIDEVAIAAGNLSDSDSFLLNTVTSNNESAVVATTDATATPGIHTVEVLATARAHTLTSLRFDTADSVIGNGTLDFRFGETTFNLGNYDTFTENPERASGQVVIDDTNNTVTGVRDAINAAGIGVQASVVDDGTGFVLVLTSDRTGDNHSMEITATEGTTPGLAALNFNATDNTPGVNMTQTVDADDAIAVIDGITITRETNTIENVIQGVDFDLIGTNAGFAATVSVNQDTAGIADRMRDFVDAFNSMRGLTDELTDFDEDEGVGALLTGDSTVRNLLSQMRRFLNTTVANVASSEFRALIDIGISTDQNANYALRFSSSKFQQAVSAQPNDVVAMLAEQTRASDSQISFVGFTDETQAGSYVVDILTPATQGAATGASVAGLAGPVVIDADNDTLTLQVDGVNSGTITLAQGSYADGAELATELQSQINQDSALANAGATVEVTYDATAQQLQIASTTYGTASTVAINSVDTDSAAELGLDVQAGVSGLNVDGTINGVQGTGVGQFLSIPATPVGATAGVYNANQITTFDTLPFDIDASNDTLAVSVDGITSGTIALTQGSYASGAEVASELQTQINADATLSVADKSVTVVWDDANSRFEITSATTGPGSSVNVTSAAAGVVSDLGISVGIGSPGQLAASIADAAAGIQIQVQGAAAGERGTVTLVRGVMNELETFLKSFVGATGTLTNKVDSLDEQIADVEAESADFNTRMNLLEERLRFQFAAADALISSLNSTSQFLDQQLASLPGYTRDS